MVSGAVTLTLSSSGLCHAHLAWRSCASHPYTISGEKPYAWLIVNNCQTSFHSGPQLKERPNESRIIPHRLHAQILSDLRGDKGCGFLSGSLGRGARWIFDKLFVWTSEWSLFFPRPGCFPAHRLGRCFWDLVCISPPALGNWANTYKAPMLCCLANTVWQALFQQINTLQFNLSDL